MVIILLLDGNIGSKIAAPKFEFGCGFYFCVIGALKYIIGFSYLVGLPGKSGVGGGIAAVYPLRYSVAVWSPRLNQKGNSVMGIKALELLTTQTQESIF